MEYNEFYLSKVGNDHDQYMLVGVKGEKSDTIAVYHNLYYAELAVEWLNQMVEEEPDL